MIDFNVNPPSKWRPVSIPKKDGSLRHLLVPCDELKAVQKNILKELYKCNMLKCPSYVCGFAPYRNTLSGALKHDKESPVIVQIDIKDFFPSFPIDEVEKELKRALDDRTAAYIMKHCVFRGKKRSQLPQGAPTSPMLTNIGMRKTDRLLSGIANRLGYTYSRYADDMCFAAKVTPYGQQRIIDNRKALIKLTEMALDKYLGLRISWKKLQISFANSPRVPRRITGITVRKDGKGYNAPKKTRKKARILTHCLWKALQEGKPKEELYGQYRQLMGLVGYCDFVRSKSDPEAAGADPMIPAAKLEYIRGVFK